MPEELTGHFFLSIKTDWIIISHLTLEAFITIIAIKSALFGILVLPLSLLTSEVPVFIFALDFPLLVGRPPHEVI